MPRRPASRLLPHQSSSGCACRGEEKIASLNAHGCNSFLDLLDVDPREGASESKNVERDSPKRSGKAGSEGHLHAGSKQERNPGNSSLKGVPCQTVRVSSSAKEELVQFEIVQGPKGSQAANVSKNGS